MQKSSFSVPSKASVSLASVLERKKQNMKPMAAAMAAGFQGHDTETIRETDTVSAIIDSNDARQLAKEAADMGAVESQYLAGDFLSVKIGSDKLEGLVRNQKVRRIQTKKLSQPSLTVLPKTIGLVAAPGVRTVGENGNGVLIGIVDSGFDLSHPMFKGADGKLRVDGLLDQTKRTNNEYTAQALQAAWDSDKRPGDDDNGHGTHVASIAGGSKHREHEGVAPGARFLLVKTDFRNTDKAVAWIFKKAGGKPCVINMSLGHHFGAHDGTDAEELFHEQITGQGKIIVIAAGNEQNDMLHVGARFNEQQSEQIGFTLLTRQDGFPMAPLTLWHSAQDTFEIELVTPQGQRLKAPQIGNADAYEASNLQLELATRDYTPSQAVQIQITISFKNNHFRQADLRGWGLAIRCSRAVVGRIDGWFGNSGFAVFQEHPLLLEKNRTVGLSATGKAAISVGSCVSRSTWDSDDGDQEDRRVVIGRGSPFSSLGPTRDDRWKPEICAPGQYVAAALAERSGMAQLTQRAQVTERLLTIEGTSMAAPVIAGVIALLLQKKPTLDPAGVRELLKQTARKDAHTGPEAWSPAYGFGKIDVLAALDKL